MLSLNMNMKKVVSISIICSLIVGFGIGWLTHSQSRNLRKNEVIIKCEVPYSLEYCAQHQ